MGTLYHNRTCGITELPKNRKPKGCTWVYKNRYKPNGEVEPNESRFVAKFYNQREGIDDEETFSPLGLIVTIHIISLAFNNLCSLFQT